MPSKMAYSSPIYGMSPSDLFYCGRLWPEVDHEIILNFFVSHRTHEMWWFHLIGACLDLFKVQSRRVNTCGQPQRKANPRTTMAAFPAALSAGSSVSSAIKLLIAVLGHALLGAMTYLIAEFQKKCTRKKQRKANTQKGYDVHLYVTSFHLNTL
jgi:hypothetical protein